MRTFGGYFGFKREGEAGQEVQYERLPGISGTFLEISVPPRSFLPFSQRYPSPSKSGQLRCKADESVGDMEA